MVGQNCIKMNARTPRPIPPDYGSFPLDRERKCTEPMTALVECLKRNNNVHSECKHLTRAYMECRATNGLMTVITSDSLDQHGLSAAEIERAKGSAQPYSRSKEKEGFIAGTGEVAAMRGGPKPAIRAIYTAALGRMPRAAGR